MEYRKLSEAQDEAWYKLIRRLEQVGCNGAYSVISVRILVNERGRPELWTGPECVKIEPKQDSVRLIDALCDSVHEFVKNT